MQPVSETTSHHSAIRMNVRMPGEPVFHGPGEAGRESAEALIARVYAENFGASISAHYPWLASIRCANGKTVAAAGFRYAERDKLYLETYLAEPVETMISEIYGVPVERDEIVEIGNLASGDGQSAIGVFSALNASLRVRGKTYAVATVTRRLRSAFRIFGFRTHLIAPANPNALPDHGQSWGRYYDEAPMILVGRIDECPSVERVRKAEGCIA